MTVKPELVRDILDSARRKAGELTYQYIREQGEDPFNCGFAWVRVKNVRGKKLDLLKEFGFKKSHYGGGYTLHNPSQSFTQDMSAKLRGAEVYAKMLREIGINAEAECRLD